MFSIDLDQALQIFVILLASVTLHEFAHAIVADTLGDPTPRRNGQISLNPTVHIEQMGLLFMALGALAGFLFAWGRTFITPGNLRWGPQRGGAVVAAAGPLTNVLIAIVLGIVLKVYLSVGHLSGCPNNPIGFLPPGWVFTTARTTNIANFLSLAINANLILFLFNLIPIPPLDGFTIVTGFLTPRQLYAIQPLVQYAPTIFLIFILLVLYSSSSSTDHNSFLTTYVFNPVEQRLQDIIGWPNPFTCPSG